jgi:CelD/BcsL family acetyltransferase involved in cellulose biosynthesis
MTPEWAAAWSQAYGTTYRLDPSLTERASGEAILPLVRHRRRPWRLEMLSARELGEPMDVLAADAAAVESLLTDLARQRQSLDLRRVPAESRLVPAVRRAYRGRGAVVVRPSDGSPTMAIDPTWAEPERHMSKRRRQDLRRAARRAEELGTVTYDLGDASGADLDGRLDDFVAVEAGGWKTRAGTALACQPEQRLFFRTYAHEMARQGLLRLSFLRIGGEVAAAQYAVQHADRLWLLKIGYDERFARCSPGTLLLLRSVSGAAAEGTRSVEFLGRSEPWTARWTTDERPYVHVLAYARRPSTVLCVGEDAFRYARVVAQKRRAGREAEGRPAQQLDN